MTSPVRESVERYVADGLEHVEIHGDAVDAMADDLADEEFGLVPWVWPPFPKVGVDMTPRETIDFFMVGNAVNFQFRDPDTGDRYRRERGGEAYKGAMGMWAALHDAYDRDPSILTGETLADLSYSDITALFDDDGVAMPMQEERHDFLTSVGERLVAAYDDGDGGRFSTLVDAASPCLYDDGDGIIDHLTRFDAFEDATTVDGHDLVFNKRAQLAVWMPLGNLAEMGKGDALRVADQEAFTIAADYHMPNIGRYTGVLSYSDDLAAAVDAGDPVVADSRAEADLRAGAVAYGLALQDALDVTGAELDGALFNGYKEDAEAAHPVHRTVTVQEPGVVTSGTTDY